MCAVLLHVAALSPAAFIG